MTVSMISCPACRTMLFSDTIVCPACQHVLDEEKAAKIGELDDYSKSRSKQIPCRNCGEANQIGLVRCWNCSSFLREDIQEVYYQMLRTERETIYSQPGSYVHVPNERPPTHPDAPPGDQGDDNSDDDFELSGDYQLRDSAPAGAPTSNGGPANTSPAAESEDTYQLSKPPVESPPAESPPPETPAPPTSSSEESQDEDAAEPPRRPIPDDDNAEDHSVATGGDVLFDIAREEEKESEKRRKKRQAALAKRRKKRKSDSTTEKDASPERLAAQKKALARRKAAQKRAAEKQREAQKKYRLWLEDIRQHRLNPQKLKLKPGSEEKNFEAVDVGCSASGVIVVTVSKKPGITLFSKPKSTPEETRKEVREYLESDKKLEDLPAPGHTIIDAETVKEIKVVQPAAYVHESMFAGIPVFGEGRIAVRLPGKPDDKEMIFLSFWLTEFRKFSQAMEKLLGLKDFGHLEGVPLTDPILDLKCHYSEEALPAIDPEAVTFFEADPTITLKLIGRRCEGCQLPISEDARRKEKIGGLGGKSIAKAKCPKCENKFGSTSLFQIDTAKKESSDSSKKKAKK